jgi:hypothetical protein
MMARAAAPPPLPAREPPSAPAAPTPTSQPDFLELLLDNSGLRASISSYTRSVNLLSFLDKSRLAELDAAALSRVVSEQFQPSAFYTAIAGQILKNYSIERLTPVAAWLRSPVTAKLAALEREALQPEARDKLVEFAANLRQTPPSESRLELIHRIYDAQRTCDIEVETTIALVHAVAMSVGPALPREKRYSSAELDRALGAVKSRYRAIMKNARIVRYLFAFESATDEELSEHAAFLESDHGKWLVSLVDKGFYGAAEAISRGLSDEIPRNLKSRPR